jgi:1-acyl-sn-glycerol-3-phosphate acyltransferase
MSPFLTKASRLILKTAGWTLVGELPVEKKFMCLAAPHTSMWDGFWMVLAAFSLGFRPDFLVKSTYVDGIFGPLILWAGGIPVLAGAGANKVDEVVEMVNQRDCVGLLLAPAGTRGKRDGWRSGFYHIAKEANLPIYFAFLDFGTRSMGISDKPIILSENIKTDMDQIREFFTGMLGKYPEKTTRMTIREEEEN